MPKRSSEKLSDRFIKSMPPPPVGSTITYDCDLPGFGIRLTAAGARSFVLNYVVDRKERRMTISGFPAWSTSAAREEARTLKRKVNLGIDPLKETETRTADAVALLGGLQQSPTCSSGTALSICRRRPTGPRPTTAACGRPTSCPNSARWRWTRSATMMSTAFTPASATQRQHAPIGWSRS